MSDPSGHRSIITLLTDFGPDSPYVASLKGVILSLQPEAVLVDLSHSIRPQEVRQAAWVLAEAAPCFPPDTIHVAVVDPGVGTCRAIVYAAMAGQHFIAPDNGLLSLLADRHRPTRLVRLDNPAFWRAEVSRTFHGRDIMAPVAAHLSRGVAADRLGSPQESLVRIDWPRPRQEAHRTVGQVVWIDSFGNLITNLGREFIERVPPRNAARVHWQGTREAELVQTYGDAPPGTLLALVGSGGWLELAVAGGSAAGELDAAPGDQVVITWTD